MLVILAYTTKSDLRRSLETRANSAGPWKIVAPFPAKADALRTAWKTRPLTEVLTISRFTQDLFESRWGQGTTEAPWRKSRLLLLLNAFKNLHPLYRDTDFGTFKTAYQVYSDLRSYTDAPDLPDELLAPFDVSVQELVKLFHLGTQRAGVRDEHAAVFDLIAELRAPEGLTVAGQPQLIFEGFTFITPAQLSFLEALAIRHEVIVPLPKSVLAAAHSWDWPQALKLTAHAIEETAEAPELATKLRLHQYPAGALGGVLRAWRHPLLGSVQIVLGTKTPTDGSLQEIPFADTFTKREVDVTSEARDRLWEVWDKKLSQVRTPLPGNTILEWCQAEKQNCLDAKSMPAMRIFKVVTMVEEALAAVDGCLEKQPLNQFLLRLLKEVIALDAPRNSLIPLLKEQATVRLFSLKDVDSLNPDLPIALCLDATFGPIKSDHRPYSPELEKELAKLGPVKRPELDFLFLKAELAELLARPLTLFVEDGLLKHDLAWKQVFEAYEVESHHWETSVPTQARADYSFFAVPPGVVPAPARVSATRLQDYLDCPRQYHAKRIEKIIPQVSTRLQVDAMAIGDMEHKLVKIGWERGETWWRVFKHLEDEVEVLLRASPVQHALNAVQRAAVIAEVALYASNGLRLLAQVCAGLPGTRFSFEVPLESAGRTGSIDCLGTGGGATVLIDFKRAQGTNPGVNQWADFNKIQLWFYLNDLKSSEVLEPNIVAGYFFFKDPDDSWLATNSEEISQKLAATMGKSAKFYPTLAQDFETYQGLEATSLERLRSEEKFLPHPLSSKVCDYCDLHALCPKSSAEREEA